MLQQEYRRYRSLRSSLPRLNAGRGGIHSLLPSDVEKRDLVLLAGDRRLGLVGLVAAAAGVHALNGLALLKSGGGCGL